MNYYETLSNMSFSALLYFGLVESNDKDAIYTQLDDAVFIISLCSATTAYGIGLFFYLN